MLSSITIPLIGVVGVAMIRRFHDPAFVSDVSVALGLGGECLFWRIGQSALGNAKEAAYGLAQSIDCTLPYSELDRI